MSKLIRFLLRLVAANKRNVIRTTRAANTASYWLHLHQRQLRAAEQAVAARHPAPQRPLRGFADVSSYNPNINWRSYAHYYDAAAVKSTEGVTWIDPTFSRNWRQLRNYGVPRIAYHFAHPGTNSPVAEARHAVRTIKAAGGLRKGDIGLALDCEVTKLSAAGTTAWCNAFHAEVHRLTGWPQILYTYKSFITWAANLVYQHVWGADYGNFAAPDGISEHRVVAWQLTDRHRTVGAGSTDFSVWRVDRAGFEALRIK